MSLRWKRITSAEIDYTHAFLPPSQINTFHPFEFPENILQNRPYLGCAAVLALKHPNPMLGYFWSEKNMAKIAAFIVSRENLNPLNTIFVFDCRQLVKSDYRQIIFEWREHSREHSLEDNKNRVKWTAHRILEKRKFRSRSLDDFCEADEKLFKILWERQKQIFDFALKRRLSSHQSLFLLLISDKPSEDFTFGSVCHLAIEIDQAQPGENYRPVLFALCGASGDWQRRTGKADKLLRALQQNHPEIRGLLDRETTTFCKQCEQIGKLPTRRRQEFIKDYTKKCNSF